jgi:hypothetical protein
MRLEAARELRQRGWSVARELKTAKNSRHKLTFPSKKKQLFKQMND